VIAETGRTTFLLTVSCSKASEHPFQIHF